MYHTRQSSRRYFSKSYPYNLEFMKERGIHSIPIIRVAINKHYFSEEDVCSILTKHKNNQWPQNSLQCKYKHIIMEI